MPDFLVIGAMKSGTTSLYHYLREHPEVFMPEKKELDFFAAGKNWSRGWDWYHEQFAGADGFVAGEASPAYGNDPNHPGVAARVHEHLPDVRLVYVIRDPLDRIESHYRHRVRYEHEQRSADDAVRGDLPLYLWPSRYAHQIDCYLEHYPAERLLVIRTEQLKVDRLAAIARVYAHIGVDPTYVPRSAGEEFLRNPPVRPRVWRRSRGHRVASDERLSAELRHELTEMLRPDLLRVRELMGPDFDAWGLA